MRVVVSTTASTPQRSSSAKLFRAQRVTVKNTPALRCAAGAQRCCAAARHASFGRVFDGNATAHGFFRGSLKHACIKSGGNVHSHLLRLRNKFLLPLAAQHERLLRHLPA